MILELKLKAEIIREKNKLDNEQKNKLNKPYYRGGSRGRVQGVRTPPPLPWDDLRFSNTTGILQKKTIWFIGVEVERRVHPLLKKILDPPLY